MQFSIRTIMFATLVVALLLVAPSGVSQILMRILFLYVPTMIVIGIIYETGERKTFYIGMGTAFGSYLYFQPLGRYPANVITIFLFVAMIAFSGCLAVWFRRRIVAGKIVPPPKPE